MLTTNTGVRRYCLTALTAAITGLSQTPTANPSAQAESACIAQQTIWKQGIEFRHTLCPPGVDVEVSPRPIPGFAGAASPIAYMVGIHNYSAQRIETDPAQWRLSWTEKNGKAREDPTLSARQVGISRVENSFGRSTLFEGQAAMGFVYFKKPKSKDATISIVFESELGSRITVQTAVSTTPIPLLP
jgi:hypothetical protein